MTDQDLQQVHKQVFAMFKIYDKFCRDNGLKYYLLCGTMLGAVRHKGFIPWDDDIDVGMPRSDYEKLLHLLCKGTPVARNISILIPGVSLNYTHDFTKLTQNCEINGKSYQVFVDVFPLDGCPFQGKFMIKIYYIIFNCLRTMKNAHYMKLEGKGVIKRAIVKLLQCIPLSTWLKILDSYLKKHSFESSKSVGNFSSGWGAKEIMDKWFYGIPTPIFFEDQYYYGVEQPDKYLSRIYGDYMKLPPEQERRSHFS